MSEDQDRWNRDQLGKAMDLIDQVAFKRINGLDVGLARTMCNMKRRLRQIDRKMEGDRRTKIQKERDASAAARVPMSGSGAAGLPAVKIPEGKATASSSLSSAEPMPGMPRSTMNFRMTLCSRPQALG